MLSQILTNVGLSAEQAEVYESLLSGGAQTASQLAKSTKVQRTYVYKVAEELVTKGLVTMDTKGKTTLYTPQSPDHLLTQAESQKQAAIQAQTALEGILPTLKSKFQAIDTRPVVTHYEGVEGIKKVFEDIYAPKTEPVYGCVDLEVADKAVPNEVVDHLIPLRIKNKVRAITFLAESEVAQKVHQKDNESLRESILLDKKDYPLPAEIDVYDDKVALLSFAKGAFVGIVIQNKDIATSLTSIFRLASSKSNPR